MTPGELKRTLQRLVQEQLHLSVMIWGPPGIGKSSVVAQVAEANEFGFVDLRLSQLAPTDLRGLPVPKDGISYWYPPEFLPQSGHGILFLDEVNMAPPTLQGIAQQLILDRKVGSYQVPPGWFIWAAGNRKEDHAAVFDMPAPLANRFIHLDVEAELDSFREYAISAGVHEHVLAFLAYRPNLLYAMDVQRPAWPSPRTWEMASAMYRAELPIEAAIGEAASAEFRSFANLYRKLIKLDVVLRGDGDKLLFPTEPSVRYATVVGLGLRARDAEQALNAVLWTVEGAPAEWVQLLMSHLVGQMRHRGAIGEFAKAMFERPDMRALFSQYTSTMQF